MLVLSRRCEQSVVVGHPGNGEPFVTVTVLEVSGSRVRLGFTAADAVPIHRLEIWQERSGVIGERGQPNPATAPPPLPGEAPKGRHPSGQGGGRP